MSYSIVASGGAASSDQNAVTTGAADTTGATLLVCVAIYYFGGTGGTMSDSKSNVWVPLTAQGDAAANVRIYYVNSATPTVGSGHTFTFSGTSRFPSLAYIAASGSAASPFDVEAGTVGDPVTTINHGAGITPTQDNELVIAGVCSSDGTTAPTIGGGFSVAYNTARTANAYGGGGAYLIQTTATAANPSWSWTGSFTAASVIASFKVGSTGSVSWMPGSSVSQGAKFGFVSTGMTP